VANVDKPDVSATAESRAANASQAHGDRPIEAGQVDRAFHATLARLTGGISPVARSLAYFDWASHLAAAPQRRMEIAQDTHTHTHTHTQCGPLAGFSNLRFTAPNPVMDRGP
jgi:hypothetical protein